MQDEGKQDAISGQQATCRLLVLSTFLTHDPIQEGETIFFNYKNNYLQIIHFSLFFNSVGSEQKPHVIRKRRDNVILHSRVHWATQCQLPVVCPLLLGPL